MVVRNKYNDLLFQIVIFFFFFILVSDEIYSRSISNTRYIRVSPNIRNSMIYCNLSLPNELLT